MPATIGCATPDQSARPSAWVRDGAGDRRSCPVAGRAVRVKPGRSYPLGATYDGSGTNFSLFSETAERVELALIAPDGPQECVDLTEMDGFVWHGYLPGAGPGQRYGFRVHGPCEPDQGQRCNPAKLLLDPYAKAIDGQVDGGRVAVRVPLRRP
jgi:pullulanase/glycogen debranching enzyme